MTTETDARMAPTQQATGDSLNHRLNEVIEDWTRRHPGARTQDVVNRMTEVMAELIGRRMDPEKHRAIIDRISRQLVLQAEEIVMG